MNSREASVPNRNNPERISRFKIILNRSRFTEEDLKYYWEDILKTHRKRHLRAVKLSFLILTLLAILFFLAVK